MTAAVTVNHIVKKYGTMTALNDISFTLKEHQIYGLLGRNGAGKTTLMHILTSQLFPTEGEVLIFGEKPFENERILRNICFIKESQTYLNTLSVAETLSIAADLYPNWNASYAEHLLKLFNLPSKRKMKQLSRGMLSSVGIIIGLSSRAPLTIFDEPYLGLDAASRSLFYDALLADYADHPRTVILSTHLIDEVSKLLDQVLIIDNGNLILNEEAETLRNMAYTVSGSAERADHFATGRRILHRETLGGSAAITILGQPDAAVRKDAAELDLAIEPVPLQKLMIHLTAASHSVRPDLERKELVR